MILALEEAKKAQEAAQSAINQANNDITGAEQDLNQVGGWVDATQRYTFYSIKWWKNRSKPETTS